MKGPLLRLVSSVRAWLRSTYGVWPLFEVRAKLVSWPVAVRSARFERREVRRLRALVDVPDALVATVVPTCGRPELLVRAVRSALAQTVEDQVVIVVDDGAGLPTLPDDDRVVAVSLSRNCGRVGVVRNVAMALSRSTYVAFLDDDNEWRPRHLDVALQSLRGGADLVYTGVERVHPGGRTLDVLSRDFDRRALRHEAFVDTSAIVLRRGRAGGFSRLPRSGARVPGEDWELVWRWSRRARVEHAPEVTVTYLVNPDSFFTRWDEPADAGAGR